MITVTQDKDANLNYWLDFGDVIGGRSLASVQIDPDSELSGITVTSQGVNSATVTDNDGETYSAGQLVGVQVSGGTAGESYEVLARVTLDSGETDDRTLVIRITEK